MRKSNNSTLAKASKIVLINQLRASESHTAKPDVVLKDKLKGGRSLSF